MTGPRSHVGVRDGTDPVPEACNDYLAPLPMLEAFVILSLWVLTWEDGVTGKNGVQGKEEGSRLEKEVETTPTPHPHPRPRVT